MRCGGEPPRQVVAGGLPRPSGTSQLQEIGHGIAELFRLGQRSVRVRRHIVVTGERQRLEIKAQRRESSSQLMGCVRRELTLGTNEFLHPLGQAVQSVDYGVDFRDSGAGAFTERSPPPISSAAVTTLASGAGEPPSLPPSHQTRSGDDEQARDTRSTITAVLVRRSTTSPLVDKMSVDPRGPARDGQLRRQMSGAFRQPCTVDQLDVQAVVGRRVILNLLCQLVTLDDLLSEVVGESFGFPRQVVSCLGVIRVALEECDDTARLTIARKTTRTVDRTKVLRIRSVLVSRNRHLIEGTSAPACGRVSMPSTYPFVDRPLAAVEERVLSGSPSA